MYNKLFMIIFMAFLTIPFFTACEAETEEEKSNGRNIVYSTNLLDATNPNGSLYGLEYIVKNSIVHYNEDGFRDRDSNGECIFDNNGYPESFLNNNGRIWHYNYNNGLDMGGHIYAYDGTYIEYKEERSYDGDNNLTELIGRRQESLTSDVKISYIETITVTDKLFRKKVISSIPYGEEELSVQQYELYIYNSDETQVERIETYTDPDANGENGIIYQIKSFNYENGRIVSAVYREYDTDGDGDIDLEDDPSGTESYLYYEQ